MAGEITSLQPAGLPSAHFDILNKGALGPFEVVAADVLLVILTESPNGTEVEAFDFDTPGWAEQTNRLVVLDFVFDTLTPNIADVATLPVFVGTLAVNSSDSWTQNFSDVGVLVPIASPFITASDTLTVTVTDTASAPVDVAPTLKTASDTLSPLWNEGFLIVQLIPFEQKGAADVLAAVLNESVRVEDFSDVDRIVITGGPVGYITITPR